jgi:hypothetical protein
MTLRETVLYHQIHPLKLLVGRACAGREPPHRNGVLQESYPMVMRAPTGGANGECRAVTVSLRPADNP